MAKLTIEVDDNIIAIARFVATQDNRITENPIFAVRQVVRRFGIEPGYTYDFMWLDDDSEPADNPEELEAEYERTNEVPDGYRRVGYIDQREFVTACFTEQACKDYIAMNRHNLNEPDIFAYGGYRNFG